MSVEPPGYGDCFVCRKHRGEIDEPGGPVYQDELVRAAHIVPTPDMPAVYLGWLVVEPRRHAAGWADLTDAEARAVGGAVTVVSRALRDSEGAEHVYTFVLGHQVPHLHVHVVPRYPGTPKEHWGFGIDEWPDAPRGGGPEIEAVCARIRAHLPVAP